MRGIVAAGLLVLISSCATSEYDYALAAEGWGPYGRGLVVQMALDPPRCDVDEGATAGESLRLTLYPPPMGVPRRYDSDPMMGRIALSAMRCEGTLCRSTTSGHAEVHATSEDAHDVSYALDFGDGVHVEGRVSAIACSTLPSR